MALSHALTSLAELLSGSPTRGHRPHFDGTVWFSAPGPDVDFRDYRPQLTGTGDDGPLLASAFAEIQAAGGGRLVLPAKPIGFSGLRTVPQGVNPVGQGNGKTNPGTTLKALDAGACLAFGGLGSANACRGGASGGFQVDGNNVATNPLYVGRAVQRRFSDIDVLRAAAGSAGLLIQEAQNCVFEGINVEDCAGDGLRLDLGCGGLAFYRFESSGNGVVSGSNLHATQSAAPGSGVYSQPTHVLFSHSIFERHAAGTVALVRHEAGADITLHDCVLAYSGTAAPLPMVWIDQALGYASTRLRIDGGLFQGDQAFSTAIKVGASAEVFVLGRPRMSNLLSLFEVASGAFVTLDVEPFWTGANVTNRSTGAGAYNTAIRSRTVAGRLASPPTTSDDVDLVTNPAGTGGYHRVNGLGTHQWAGGTDFVWDTALARAAGGGLTLDKPMEPMALWLRGVVTKTANYTATLTDALILCDASGGAFTVTLPPASGRTGAMLTAKRTSASGNAVVDGNAGETIDGALTKTLGSQWAFVTLVCDGAGWQIVAQGGTVT